MKKRIIAVITLISILVLCGCSQMTTTTLDNNFNAQAKTIKNLPQVNKAIERASDTQEVQQEKIIKIDNIEDSIIENAFNNDTIKEETVEVKEVEKEEIKQAIEIIQEEVRVEEVKQEIKEEQIKEELVKEEIKEEQIIEKEEYKLNDERNVYPEHTVSQEILDTDIMDDATFAETAEVKNQNTVSRVIDAATTEPSADGIELQFTAEEVKTIPAARAASSVDGVEVTLVNKAPEEEQVKNTSASYLGTLDGKKRAITLVGDDTFRNLEKLQAVIDANNIVCYPTNDLTQGVKYLAGHNPGAMSHISGGMKIGTVVRLSNDEMYQDYVVVERLQNVTGSFANARFSTTGYDAWTMMMRAQENALIIQFCVNGQNNLWYCQAC